MDYYLFLSSLYNHEKNRRADSAAELIHAVFQQYGSDISCYDPEADYLLICEDIRNKAAEIGHSAFECGFESEGAELRELAAALSFYKRQTV